MTLQDRANAFLARPIPKDIDYVPGSVTERIIGAYAATGTVEIDPELAELLELCAMEAKAAANEGPAARRAYFGESAAILGAILDEA